MTIQLSMSCYLFNYWTYTAILLLLCYFWKQSRAKNSSKVFGSCEEFSNCVNQTINYLVRGSDLIYKQKNSTLTHYVHNQLESVITRMAGSIYMEVYSVQN